MTLIAVHVMAFREHALMQNPRNKNAAGFLPVKHDMAAMLETSQSSS